MLKEREEIFNLKLIFHQSIQSNDENFFFKSRYGPLGPFVVIVTCDISPPMYQLFFC